MISPPLLGLIQVSEDTWCQVYSQFYVLYKAGTTLEISAVQGEPPQGKQVPEVSVELPEGYEMTLTGNKKGCLLKRLSFHNNALPVLTINDFSLEAGENGHFTMIRQQGQLYARHIWGTGERYHAVDLRSSFSNGIVTEKFTQQGEQTYLPIPFFMTEQCLGCFVDSTIPVGLDFRDCFSLEKRVNEKTLLHEIWFFGSPQDLLKQFILRTGNLSFPPIGPSVCGSVPTAGTATPR